MFRDRSVGRVTPFSRRKRSQRSQLHSNANMGTSLHPLGETRHLGASSLEAFLRNWLQKSKRKFQVCMLRRAKGCQMLWVRDTEVVRRLLHRRL
ncbi:unnamed protein product [Ixodes pacificus]